MNDVNFLLTLLSLAFGFVAAMVVLFIAQRDSKRFFAEHPEYPNPYERKHAPKHTPAE
ncbi:MAG TPA: hypothetical protein VHB74_02805 [Devosia sp.]|nr:hypothetical protein [Devosia sp.]